MTDYYAFCEPRYTRWESPPMWLTYLRMIFLMLVCIWVVFRAFNIEVPVWLGVGSLAALVLALEWDLRVKHESVQDYICTVCHEFGESPAEIDHDLEEHRLWRNDGDD